MRARLPGRPRRVDRRRRRRRPAVAAEVPRRDDGQDLDLAARAKETDLVLHIGLHKTATTYTQGLLAASRDRLLEQGVLYPTTGLVDKDGVGTRAGAGSGQAHFSRRGRQKALKDQLLAELPAGASTVLISSEEFTRGAPTPAPARLAARFSGFRSLRVILVLRRQDDWIESYYKQVVDQFNNYETRSFEDYVREKGMGLLDFHDRFGVWRDLVGPEHFHVLSYDDLADGTAICRRILELTGVEGPLLDSLDSVTVPRYESVRSLDTLGLRILNAHHLDDRATRTRTAQAIYDLAPEGDIDLMTAELREEIQAMCAPINERIEAEWFTEPVPGFRFGRTPRGPAVPPTGPAMVEYVDRVLAVCSHVKGRQPADAVPGGEES